ncbi:MAG: hypothetical protein ABSE06_00795 [Anaerolineaceae bacterium]|jgi:uncharacterized protein YraI
MQKKAGGVTLLFLVIIMTLLFSIPVRADNPKQISTVAMATVTGTPSGQFITVLLDQPQINVRGGPGTAYPKVGVLLAGQQAPAKGVSSGGEWIMIDYPGIPGGVAWVYSALVNVSPGQLPVVEPPPTPTPLYTATIDPTLAAQFIVTSAPTRLPTFTPPPPLVIPTFQTMTDGTASRLPMGLVIILAIALGAFLGLVSLFQR